METKSGHIEEIVEKLRAIEKTDPELYKEAWGKLPERTQAAILSYESHHKSKHPLHAPDAHGSSHTSSSTSSHSFHPHSQTSSFYESHQKAAQTHADSMDWEATEGLRPVHPKASGFHTHTESEHQLKAALYKAMDDPASSETSSTKHTSSTSREEAERDLKKSVSAQIPRTLEIMKHAANEKHLPNTLQEVLLATQVYELELIRIGIDRLAKKLEK